MSKQQMSEVTGSQGSETKAVDDHSGLHVKKFSNLKE